MASVLFRAVTQAVLLFGSETLVLFMAMERTVEGTHTGFLRQITDKRVWWKSDGMWVTPRAEVVQ